MKKVVTINLNGHAYQVDEDSYDLLHSYLDQAAQTLRDNPDRDEIIADLEQAIAEKCQRFMDAQKSVVSASDVRQLLAEMGSVDAGASESGRAADTGAPQGAEAGATGQPGATGATARAGNAGRAGDASASGAGWRSATAPKRFYRITDGAWLGGVCTGIGAYLNVDPTMVRVAWGFLLVLDFSVMKVPLFTLGYLAIWSIVPEASTSEQRAAASGAAFNAHEIVEEAKRRYADFRKGQSKKAWRQQRREFRKFRRNRFMHDMQAPTTMPGVFARGVRMTAGGFPLAAGGFAPLLTLSAVLMFWLMVFVVLSLADSRTFYRWSLPADVPLWVALLGIVIAYHWIVWPLRMARRASHYAAYGHPGWGDAWDNLSGIAFTALILWFGYTNVPEVRNLVEKLPDLWHRFLEWTITISKPR